MVQFEYLLLQWGDREDEASFVARLDQAGAEGWEAVGLAPRAMSVPMPGMGANSRVEIAVILKRTRTA